MKLVASKDRLHIYQLVVCRSLFARWEGCLELLRLFRGWLPAGSDGLPPSVELNSSLTVEVGSAPHALFASGEGEHREGDRNREIDADLPGLDLGLEFAGDAAVLGEDGGAVAPWVGVGQVDSVLEVFSPDDDHGGSEDLLVVASHAWSDVVDHGWPEPIALWIALDLVPSAIEQKIRGLGSISDELLGSAEPSGTIEGSDVWVLEAWPDREGPRLRDELWDPLPSVSDEDDD